jgi:hypothetical protein
VITIESPQRPLSPSPLPRPAQDEPGTAPDAAPDVAHEEAETSTVDVYSVTAEALRLVPSPSASVPVYERDAFGTPWIDRDENGCDTRNDVLQRDLERAVLRAGDSCRVARGTLRDPYTGGLIEFIAGPGTSLSVQIDHVVPLAWAWRSGAWQWSFDRRVDFANDPRNLLAVDGTANQQKSDSGPSEWLPANTAVTCDYVLTFAEVVLLYELAVPDPDRQAIVQVLSSC